MVLLVVRLVIYSFTNYELVFCLWYTIPNCVLLYNVIVCRRQREAEGRVNIELALFGKDQSVDAFDIEA